MNIWVICQYYPPETGAPSARISGFAKSWLAAKENVLVLTGIPNHPEGVVHPDYIGRPAYHEELMDGVHVRRHWIYVAPNKGKIRRMLNQLSFALSVLKHNWRAPNPLPDVIIASSPSFFCVVSAWLLARRHKAKFVFEVRDLWPAIFLQMGILKPGLIYSTLSFMEKFLYKRADAIVTVTRSFARNIIERGIKAEKIYVVHNGVSDSNYTAAIQPRTNGEVTKLRTQLGLSPLARVVLYIGNHGQAQALTQIIDAARLLVKRTDTTFLFVGSGADKEKLQNYARGIPNVQFLPSVEHAQTWTYYAMADINLVCLKNIPDFDMFIPSKMFEIMAAQSCAVGALRGEGAQIMRESGSALVVDPENPDALANAITTLLDDPARREQMALAGRAYVAQHFLHNMLATQYLNLLKQLSYQR